MSTTSFALAELLLRRKELAQKVEQLARIREADWVEVRVARKKAHEGVDDVMTSVPKVPITELTHAYDWHARQLRRVDAAIQRANWETQVALDPEVMADYVAPPSG